MNILLTGSRAPVSLDLGRRFQRAGHQVFQADCLRYGMAKLSQSAIRSFHTPRPVESPQRYAQALAEIIQVQQIDWLIPTCEEVFYIAAFRSSLPCNVLVDDFEKLNRIHNKWIFSQSFGNSFAAAPETLLLDGAGQVGIPAHEASEEWVFKPVYSRFAGRTLVGPSREKLQKSRLTWREPWIAQRRIRGTEFSTYSIARNGRLIAHAAYESLYRVGVGSGICFQPVQIAKIEAFVKQFVESTAYHGQIGFDLIQDQQGKLWVLEGNPRATSGAQLFASQDPLAEALTLQRDQMLRPSSTRPAMIEFAMPLWGVWDAIRSGKCLNFLPDLFRSRWMTVSLRDLWPTLGLPLSLWEIARIAFRENRTLQQASTFDIEWNGEPM